MVEWYSVLNFLARKISNRSSMSQYEPHVSFEVYSIGINDLNSPIGEGLLLNIEYWKPAECCQLISFELGFRKINMQAWPGRLRERNTNDGSFAGFVLLLLIKYQFPKTCEFLQMHINTLGNQALLDKI